MKINSCSQNSYSRFYSKNIKSAFKNPNYVAGEENGEPEYISDEWIEIVPENAKFQRFDIILDGNSDTYKCEINGEEIWIDNKVRFSTSLNDIEIYSFKIYRYIPLSYRFIAGID
ncbi:Uncharacterised protein [uncultured Clostridium sp.]|uniref:hypothetical protein n=1 Tax=uncultured Clostridium sp. TaxID=59620 RepID=UPI000822DF66|nr:hypothetical protein [uncultured Clostridium sp.]SCI99843.1 Uncharacterised protein [uncultured Clostridium sp.]